MRVVVEEHEKFAHGPDRVYFLVMDRKREIGRFANSDDAVLCAAAPEMLAALERVAKYLELIAEKDPGDGLHERRVVRWAIKAAKGE